MNTFSQKILFLAASTSLLALSLVGTAGCHRATEADCEQIIDRLVELELKEQGITDPAVVNVRKKETKARKRDELIGSCVGKRISHSAMACIRNAKSAAEVTDECLR